MAIRIHTAITHGEIDNTERGRVRCKLWLLDHPEPVELDLNGDAWRDVAGSRVTFVNPTAETQKEAQLLQSTQTGMVGDITASRKVKVFTVPEEEWRTAYQEDRIVDVPTEWRNSLYLEWFTAEQGRCVVESADFEITISERVWELDEDEEGAQKLANMHAMRDFLAAIIQRPEPTEEDEEEDESEAYSEEAWEIQLKASDRLAEASLEAYDKYGEDDDSDEKTAFVMGWDHLLEDMADAREGVEASEDDSEEKKRRQHWAELMQQASEEVENDDTWSEEEQDEPHPLKDKSHQFVSRVMDEIMPTGLNALRGVDREHPLDRFVSSIMRIRGKLAGALYSRGNLEDPMQRGYVLAITKRCLNWSNEALSALNDLISTDAYAEHRKMFEGWREGLFQLRGQVTDLREELREQS